MVLPLLYQGEHHVPGKAVGGDGVGLSVQIVGVLPQPGDEGKQDGGPAGPDIRVALPQVLGAVGGLDGGELGPQVLHPDGEKFILNGIDHGAEPPFICLPSSTASTRASPS